MSEFNSDNQRGSRQLTPEKVGRACLDLIANHREGTRQDLLVIFRDLRYIRNFLEVAASNPASVYEAVKQAGLRQLTGEEKACKTCLDLIAPGHREGARQDLSGIFRGVISAIDQKMKSMEMDLMQYFADQPMAGNAD